MAEKNGQIYFIGFTEGKIENLKKEGKMRVSILIFIYSIHFAYMKVCTKFENNGFNRSKRSVTEIFIEEKENEQIKGLISNMWLFLLHNKLITIKLCIKFQNPKSCSC